MTDVFPSQAAELKELKEFTTKLKSLPQIQRHIELLSAMQNISGRPGFKQRVSMEQELLDSSAVEPACQFVEVRSAAAIGLTSSTCSRLGETLNPKP